MTTRRVNKRVRKDTRYAPRPRRCLVTADLGEEGLFLLDQCCAWMQQTSYSSRKITRSLALREAVQALYDRINAANSSRPEVTVT